MRKSDPASLQSAIDAFTAAVKISNTNRYIAYYNRARLLTFKGQFDAAIADFAEAQAANPAAIQIQNYRCVTYTAMGKFDQALADCNDVLAKTPRAAYALTSRGDAYLGKGNLNAALADYNAALAISPNYIRAYAARGRFFEKRGDLVRARADYRSASSALAPFDNFDNGIARNMAKERLVALTAQQSAKAGGSSQRAPPPPGGRRIALVIGNGGYKRVQRLDNPPRDAQLIAQTLREVGFQSVTLAADLTRDKFFAALQAFAAEAEQADWALVYYAGHGLEIGGVNYMVPIDATLAADRDAETEAVALEQVIAAVGGARKLRLVLLDACRDDPFQARMQKTIALKLVNKGLANIEPDAGTMVVYAAKHGETALDGDASNSPFATAVARDVKEPRIEVRKLFDIVRDDVWAASKHQQQPFTYGSPPGREDFYFVAAK
jgi:tetratricopeptide (TPR) repeat protein